MRKPADDWWRGAVIYQIYPRSFMDTDGDGIGDLKGIATKLDYVASLGVDGIWLSPFFKSPMRDYGYDVSDYRAVDPMFGELADFDALLTAAHQRGLKVIIDQVYSHSSSDYAWFQESRQCRTNAKADWYVWADPTPAGAPPNNWQAWFGGPTWTWEPRRRQYYLHNFLSTQPDLNVRNPDVQEEILATARFWLDRGVDGFRLDVANYYVHDAQLRDNPPSGKEAPALPRDMQHHSYNSNQPETLDFIAKLRATMDSYGARMTVGELAPGSYGLMNQYTRGQNGLHTAYAFDFLGAWPGVEKMAEILSQWNEGQGDGWPSWAFSNHDVTRVATRWGDAIWGESRVGAELFLALLLSLRGTIFLYQGEELGLQEGDVPYERLRDPWGIAGWPATKGRDGCRTPMPWTDGIMGGFTRAAEAWLPIDARQRAAAVERQERLTGSTLQMARQLIALRKANDALSAGAFRVVRATDGLLVFDRVAETQTIRCAFNFANAETHVALDGKPEVLWTANAVYTGDKLVMESSSAALLRLA